MSRQLLIVSAVMVAVLGGTGCRQEEQGRPTSFTPGVYQGLATPPLTKEQVTELKKRGELLR